MNERESGWYRVWIKDGDFFDILYWDGIIWWYGESVFSDTTIADCGFDVHEMVMNKKGQIVYNQSAHDPLCNTKREW